MWLKKMTTSPEYQTFKQHYNDLKTALDPSSVVATAFATDLLTPGERRAAEHSHYTDDEKMEKFLSALDRRIAVNPDAFRTFVDEVLEGEPAFHHLVELLKSMLPCEDINWNM